MKYHLFFSEYFCCLNILNITNKKQLRRVKYILDKAYSQIYNFQIIILTIYNVGLTGNCFTFFVEIHINSSDKVKKNRNFIMGRESKLSRKCHISSVIVSMEHFLFCIITPFANQASWDTTTQTKMITLMLPGLVLDHREVF